MGNHTAGREIVERAIALYLAKEKPWKVLTLCEPVALQSVPE